MSDVNKKYLFWVNDPSITEYLEIGSQPLKHNDLVRYIKDSPKKGRFNYAIITSNSQKHIGNCSIFPFDEDKKNFTIGYFIGEKTFWGGHYSSMVIFNLLKIGFNKMGFKKCIGGVYKSHIKASMTNKFSGFKEIKKSKNLIRIEISKKRWLDNAMKLSLKFPKLYEYQ